MRLHIFSDLHLDHGQGAFLPTFLTAQQTKHDIAVIAGDICRVKNYSLLTHCLSQLSKAFRHIIYVPGNHEYYQLAFESVTPTIQALCHHHGWQNIHLLTKSNVFIDDVEFIGSTLWSSCQALSLKHHALLKLKMKAYHWQAAPLLDYQEKIQRIAQLHQVEKQYIFNRLAKKQSSRARVVISHHGPSYQSISPSYQDDPHASLYVSDLDKDIYDHQPDFWIHGHTHSHADYRLGKTQVIANPLGLPHEQTAFEGSCNVDI